ncbi:MAG: hypothetical protein DRO88_09100 [Promethearchaeia archaeon]|nr:MAG: hypothetical protein DRO88_09100 [Candidatus Lokiarchaeia archaeon]
MSPKIRIDEQEIEIIEEDYEKELNELLKYKISWKTILKIIILTILAAIAIYFIVIDIFPSDAYIYSLVIVCIIGGIVLISLEHEDDTERLTISILQCQNCDFQTIKAYDKGDYVFKNKGKCSNCERNLQITGIYSVKLAKKQKELKNKKN